MSERLFNVLFLCTGNSARSIIAEALLRELGGGRFEAFSAGSHPSGEVDALALDMLHRAGCDTTGLRSKSWNEFAAPAAPALDFIITVCDSAARETCPAFPGAATRVHWSVADPSGVDGPLPVRMASFQRTVHALRRRVQHLTGLPFDSVDRRALGRQLRDIGYL